QTGGGDFIIVNSGSLSVVGATIGGAGNASFTANGPSSDITVGSLLSSGSGNITANAGRNVTLNGAANIMTSGTVALSGATGNISETGTATINAGTLVTNSVGG